MADTMKKNYKISGSGVMDIDNGRIIISCEDKGEYDLSHVLLDLDGCQVKFSFSYDEDYDESLDIDTETGEIL